MRKNFLNAEKCDDKIIPFKKAQKYYGKLIDEKADNGDFIGALSMAFSSLKNEFSFDTLADIADIYADMGEYELSDEYWYKYLSCAPEDKKSIAYEELAINAFDLKNYGLAAYYIDKKMSVDGFLSRKDLGQEMLDFLSEGINKKDLYKIVYPEEKSDYSTEITLAKNAALAGNFEMAAGILKNVPKASPSYSQAAEELSMAYFAMGKVSAAIEINRDLLARFGKNASVYFNLASMYRAEKDFDKSAYYYSLAKNMPIDEDSEMKFALCAIEQEDHAAAVKALEKIIDDDYYDAKIIGYYGLALFNVGEYEKAEEVLKKAYMIDPRNPVAKYYARLALDVSNGNTKRVSVLPYDGDLPKKEVEKRLKTLDKVLSGTENLKPEEKRNINDYISWGLFSGGAAFKKSVVAAVSEMDKERENLISDALISGEIAPNLKQSIIFMLVSVGYKKRIYTASDGVFFSFKPRKLPCEKDEDSKFFIAYCTALSKMAFSGENMDKIAFSVNELYKKFNNSELIKMINYEELAAAAVVGCEYETFKKPDTVYDIFGVKKEKMKTLIDCFGAEKYGKNN